MLILHPINILVLIDTSSVVTKLRHIQYLVRIIADENRMYANPPHVKDRINAAVHSTPDTKGSRSIRNR